MAMETEEFGKRIMAFRGKLMRQAQAFGETDVSAEDLVQETLLRLWDMRHRLKTHPNCEALAFSILRNMARDHWRHRQIEREEWSGRREIPVDDRQVEATDEVRLISRIVEGLPALQQRIFRMKEIEGYTTAEIIRITGCTAESLRQNLSRARRHIREEFIRMTKERTPK